MPGFAPAGIWHGFAIIVVAITCAIFSAESHFFNRAFPGIVPPYLPTPADDSEFTTPGNQGAQNGIDLLTVLENEFGHILGYDDTDAGLMSPTLTTPNRGRTSSIKSARDVS